MDWKVATRRAEIALRTLAIDPDLNTALRGVIADAIQDAYDDGYNAADEACKWDASEAVERAGL